MWGRFKKDASAKIRVSGAIAYRLWQAGLLIALLWLVWSFAGLWLGAEAETKEALRESRRLAFSLQTGEQVELTQKTAEASKEEPVKEVPVKEEPAKEEPPAQEPAPETKDAPPLEQVVVKDEPVATVAVPTETIQVVAGVNKELLEKTEQGLLPIVGKGGVKPWQFYRKPDSGAREPMVAIVVVGLGLSKKVSEAAVALPQNVSLSFSPYAKELNFWTTAARGRGHEFYLDMPTESVGFPSDDPGPNALLLGISGEENAKRLAMSMAKAPGFVGMVMAPDEAFSANATAFGALTQVMTKRGQLLVMGKEPASPDAKNILRQQNVAAVFADYVVDEEQQESGIKARLAALEQLAKKRGTAIGLLQSYPLSIAQVQVWADELSARGVNLVPVSAIAAKTYD